MPVRCVSKANQERVSASLDIDNIIDPQPLLLLTLCAIFSVLRVPNEYTSAFFVNGSSPNRISGAIQLTDPFFELYGNGVRRLPMPKSEILISLRSVTSTVRQWEECDVNV